MLARVAFLNQLSRPSITPSGGRSSSRLIHTPGYTSEIGPKSPEFPLRCISSLFSTSFPDPRLLRQAAGPPFIPTEGYRQQYTFIRNIYSNITARHLFEHHLFEHQTFIRTSRHGMWHAVPQWHYPRMNAAHGDKQCTECMHQRALLCSTSLPGPPSPRRAVGHACSNECHGAKQCTECVYHRVLILDALLCSTSLSDPPSSRRAMVTFSRIMLECMDLPPEGVMQGVASCVSVGRCDMVGTW